MERTAKARLQLIISMTIFGTIGAFTRRIPLSSGELALYRAVLAVGLIGIYLLVTGQKLDGKEIRKVLPLLFLSGAAIGINWILLFQAYRYTTVSVATLSYYFAPVIVTVASPFLFREKMTGKQIACFVMSTVGLILIVGIPQAGGDRNHVTGILFGLGAAVFYAAVVLLNKYIKNVSGIHRTLMQFIAAIVVLLPYVWYTDGIHPGRVKGEGLLCLLIVGLVHTGITYCMYFSSLKELKGQETAILSYIDPLVAVVVSVLILKEGITALQIVGGALILGFTIWNEKEQKG